MNLYGLSTELIGHPLFSAKTTPVHALGTVARDESGRVFRYCSAGAAALVVGNVLQAAAAVADHTNLTPTVTTYGAIGDITIVATLNGTAVAAENLYADGFAQVSTTPGLGYSYRISGHAAVGAGGVITIQLANSSPIQVALTGSSRVSLVQNPYKAVIQSPMTAATGAIVGVAVYPIPAGQYGWIQTGGVAAVLIDETGAIAVGQAVGYSAAVPGAAAILSGTLAQIGRIMVSGQDAIVQPVILTLDS